MGFQEEEIKEKKKGVQRADIFGESSEGLGMEPLKLIMDGKTRWNSTFRMLDRAVHLKRYINMVLVNSDDDDLLPTPEEWKIVAEVCEVLHEFYRATEVMSAEKYPTLSFVFPLFSALIKFTKRKRDLARYHETQEMCEAIDADLSGRWRSTIELDHLLACFLDPRFKALTFIEDPAMRTLIREKAAKKLSECKIKERPKNPEKPIPKQAATIVDSLFAEVDEAPPGDDEMGRYMAMPKADRDVDILKWWKTHEQELPRLGKNLSSSHFVAMLARKYLCIMSTSVPCERLFSRAGAFVTKNRARMSPETIEKMMFLNGNVDLLLHSGITLRFS